MSSAPQQSSLSVQEKLSGTRSQLYDADVIPPLPLKFQADEARQAPMARTTDRFYLFEDDPESPLLKLLEDPAFKARQEEKEERKKQFEPGLLTRLTSKPRTSTQSIFRDYTAALSNELTRMTSEFQDYRDACRARDRQKMSALEAKHQYMVAEITQKRLSQVEFEPETIVTPHSVYLSYALTRRLGAGGFGVVYKGEHVANTADNDLFVYGRLNPHIRRKTNGMYDIQLHLQTLNLKKHYLSTYKENKNNVSLQRANAEKAVLGRIAEKIKLNPTVAIKFIFPARRPKPRGRTGPAATDLVVYNYNVVMEYCEEAKNLILSGKGGDDGVGVDNIVHMLFIYPESVHYGFSNYAIAFEYMERGTLLDIILKPPHISKSSTQSTSYQISDCWAKHWFLQLCAGVHFLHKRSITHNDLKPANLMLTAQYDLKIGDLGLGEPWSDDVERKKKIFSYGTPFYVQSKDDYRQSPDTVYQAKDIYAMGAILGRMILGTDVWLADKFSPAYADNAEENEMAVAQMNRNFVRGLHERAYKHCAPIMNPHTFHKANPRAVQIVLRCMAPNLAHRYHTVADIVEEAWLNPDTFTGPGISLTEVENAQPLANGSFDRPAEVEVRGERGHFIDRSFGIYADNKNVYEPNLSPHFKVYGCAGGRRFYGEDDCISQCLVGQTKLKEVVKETYGKMVGRNVYFFGFMKELFGLLISKHTKSLGSLKAEFEMTLTTHLGTQSENTAYDLAFETTFDNYIRNVPDFVGEKAYYKNIATCACFKGRTFDAGPEQGSITNPIPSVVDLSTNMRTRYHFLGLDTRPTPQTAPAQAQSSASQQQQPAAQTTPNREHLDPAVSIHVRFFD